MFIWNFCTSVGILLLLCEAGVGIVRGVCLLSWLLPSSSSGKSLLPFVGFLSFAALSSVVSFSVNTKCLKNLGKAILALCSAASNNEDCRCIEMEALEVGGMVVVVVASKEAEKKQPPLPPEKKLWSGGGGRSYRSESRTVLHISQI
ncbi:hypothetical protein JHK86_001284 [Glycine max]|nr:hypothetical protein JHK86_001284 [Glycine max]